MIVRTCLFDEILLRLVREQGVTTVLNLAAGFDTRPLRLPLPATTRWIEADLPPLLDEKEALLAGERAVCDLERVKVDLADPTARRALFARLGADGRPTAIAAEGLLIYLSPQQVGELAADLHAQPGFRWWVIDLAHPHLLKMMQRGWGKKVAEGGAPFRFAPKEGPEFFRAFGWRPVERRFTWEEARILRREMPFAGFFRLLGRLASKEKQELYRRLAEVVLLERI
jgi:methyltransferase (TIGR00027 family)